MKLNFLNLDIVREDGRYITFPGLARMQDGRLLLVYRQALDRRPEYGTITHVDPSSRIVMRTSDDSGSTWSEAKVLYDDEMGEQDPCLTCLKDGTLICTFFRWKIVPKEEKESLGEAFRQYGRIVFDRWAAVHVGTMCLRSCDNGTSWEGPFPLTSTRFEGSPAMRGNIVELDDGRLLAPLYGIRKFGLPTQCLILQSSDRGSSWQDLGEIPMVDDLHFVEPSLHRSPSGRLTIFMRTHRRKEDNGVGAYENLHCSFSDDLGKTWSIPAPTDLYCPNPVTILERPDGLLFTYGQRRDPKGIEAVLTGKEDPRPSSENAFVIRKVETADDLGYTAAVGLDDGSALVVYYLTDANETACIGSTRISAS